MTSRIFKSIFITAIVVLAISFSILFAFTYDSYNKLAENDIKRESEYVISGIKEYGYEYLSAIHSDKLRVTHMLPDGSVSYDTSGASDGESYAESEEFKEARENGTGMAFSPSSNPALRIVSYAVRLDDGSVIRVSSEHYSPLTLFIDMLQGALLICAVLLVIAYLVARKLSDGIVKPINDIDLEHPENTKPYPELLPIVERLTQQKYSIARQLNELTRRQNEFDSITSNMSEGMMVINTRAEILSCNKSARDILELPRELPKSVLSVSGEEGFRMAILSALSGEMGYYHLSASGRAYTISVTPVMERGSVEGAVMVILDTTEREEREALRREFTANVSHELKTPLTSISGFAELIRDGVADAEDARHFAGNIYKEAKRLINLVVDIIRLGQVDGGEIPFDKEPVRLDSVALEVKERLSQIAEGKQVTLVAECERIAVKGNRQLVDEMIYNLVDNAIKYNVEGGSVSLRVSCEDGVPTLSVSDTGIGIPQSEQSRVFERFYRVDKSHSRSVGGTGLGLSIVKHSVIYHKAEIELSSEQGKGTVITVRFPRGSSFPVI